MSTPTRDDFLAECLARPDDMTARLVFADWLEERGESAEADAWRESDGTPLWYVVRLARELNTTLRQPLSRMPDCLATLRPKTPSAMSITDDEMRRCIWTIQNVPLVLMEYRVPDIFQSELIECRFVIPSTNRDASRVDMSRFEILNFMPDPNWIPERPLVFHRMDGASFSVPEY